MSNVAFLITPSNVTISRDGKTLIVNQQYDSFKSIVEKLKARAFDEAYDLADKALTISKKSNGVFTVKNGIVYRDGLPIHNVISDRIMEFQKQGLPFEPLVIFLENLLKNPSERSITELYKFLEHQYLPVTQDGCFLAYKSVRNDMLSATSGTTKVNISEDGGKTWVTVTGRVPNKVGSIIEVDRNDVDDDETQTCSFGLHVGDVSYASTFSERMIVVKVNPKDAVSVPIDENARKLRVSRYEVIAEYEKPISKPLTEAKRPTIIAKNKGVSSDGKLANNMVLTMTGKVFTKADVTKAVKILQKTAEKYLKLRFKRGVIGFGAGNDKIYSKVTGEGQIISRNKLVIQVKLPLDSRYKQPKPAEFNKAWQSAIKNQIGAKNMSLQIKEK